MLTPLRIALLLVLAAALIVVPFVWPSDGQDDLADDVVALRAELREREDAEAELRERIEELEAAQLPASEPDDDGPDPHAERLDDVEEELARLVDALTVLEADLDAGASSRAELQQRIDAVDADLRGALGELRGGIDELRGQLALLRDRVEVLTTRIDDLERQLN